MILDKIFDTDFLKNALTVIQKIRNFLENSDITIVSRLGIDNTCFPPYEQFLTLESIDNCRQNLNLSPRTNPMKAMTSSPSNV